MAKTRLRAADVVIGIDCGVGGALAAVDGRTGRLLGLEDLPVQRDGSLAWIDARALVEVLSSMVPRDAHATAAVERLHAMPRRMGGTRAAMSRGLTLGSLLAALALAGIGVELVAPAEWRRALGMLRCGNTDRARKAASLERARLLYPTADLRRVKDHNRAEALLIACYAVARRSGRLARALENQ